MQVSTRANDYLVDTLLLCDAIGPALRPVFARSDVLKVLHGCVCDIEWLQKDFGVWVVCAFDTQQAAKLLDLPIGFGPLLLQYTGIKVRLPRCPDPWVNGCRWCGAP